MDNIESMKTFEAIYLLFGMVALASHYFWDTSAVPVLFCVIQATIYGVGLRVIKVIKGTGYGNI